jgi:peptide/nickel transport system ATP-binding protein/oligopeptide transport system ATP-binding protein
VEDLHTVFRTDDGLVPAVTGVSFEVREGETLGVVGESGCGKSVTALSVLRLIPSPPGEITGGEIRLRGKNLLAITESEMRRLRGNEISMIFQEPMTALNPVYTIGDQIMEAIRLHQKVGKSEARKRAIDMLTQVGIPIPDQRVDNYPHQLSGGMRQRVMIAMALSCNPALLIADEPTTALDVTIQAQILDLLRSLQDRLGMAILLITHDLGVVAENADRVAVMYAGRVVEYTGSERLFASPAHPYTIGLLNSMPRLDNRAERLRVIPGSVPPPTAFPPGCAFHPRCPFAEEACRKEIPALETVAAGHAVRCLRWREIPGLMKAGVGY